MKRKVQVIQLIDLLGEELLHILARIRSHRSESIYLTGGTVRDLLMERVPVDIDLTVQEDARGWAGEFSRLTGGTLVPLGRDEDAARVVWQGRDVDFSSFREGALTIDEELTKRDITINSLAVSLQNILLEFPNDTAGEIEVNDPVKGLDDLAQGVIRATSDLAFRSDPLRLLRVIRFGATLGFSVSENTLEKVRKQKELIARPAPERIAYELEQIMRSGRAYRAFRKMAEVGLLFEIIPELQAGVGMEQPASHHLDVFEHSLEALRNIERIQAAPDRFFPGDSETMERYIRTARHAVQLKWASLLHDLGKPPAMAIDEERGGRITFYNHDREGAELVGRIARRLRWSRQDEKIIGTLVALHMRPFFLSNEKRNGTLTVKGCLRLLRAAEGILPGLFLLGMADAAAGKGEDRPEDMEKEIAALFHHLEQVRIKYLEPVRSKPPLLTGRDLIDELGLVPGPVFREILQRVEEEHMENTISSRQEALELARRYLEQHGEDKRTAGKGK